MPLTDEDKVQVAQIVGDLLAKVQPAVRTPRIGGAQVKEVHVELYLDPELKELFNAGQGEFAPLAVMAESLRVLREIRDRLPAAAASSVVPTAG